jgi:mRNA interferase YafQ
MNRYEVVQTSKFRKDYARLKKRGYDMSRLQNIVNAIARGETLPERCQDHPLQGDRRGYRDCHIQSDWVLIYKIDDNVLTLVLAETGTHSDILE